MDKVGFFYWALAIPVYLSNTMRTPRLTVALFLLLLALNLTYIWQQPYFLTSDGPAHVHNASLLNQWLHGHGISFFKQFYSLHLQPEPNWFTHAVLLLLQQFFSPIVCEKLLLSLYALLFPLSLWYTGRQFNRSAGLSLLLFPLSFHFLLYYGFYNYCFGLTFAICYIGLWQQLRSSSYSKQVMGLLPASVLVYLTHILGWLVIAVVLGGIFFAELGQAYRGKHLRFWRTTVLRHWAVLVFCGALPIVLSLLFVSTHTSEIQYYPQTVHDMWQAFVSLQVLQIFSPVEISLSVAYIVLLGVLFGYTAVQRLRTRTFLAADGFLFAIPVFLVLYLWQPVSLSMAGFWIGRMSWLPWLLLACWLGTQTFPHRMVTVVSVLLAVLTIGFGWLRMPYQQKLSAAETDYLSAIPSVNANTVILPLSFAHEGLDEQGRVIAADRKFFLHAFDYCGTDKPVINLTNFEATTSWFPLHWQQGIDPQNQLGVFESAPGTVALAAYNNYPGRRPVDFVITWCMPTQPGPLLTDLQNGYERVYTSPTGRTLVWKKK